MNSCCGNCSGCSGCGKSLELTEKEIVFLRSLGEIPFQPLARKLGEDIPIYPGRGEETTRLLQLLERKGLISLDYDKPLAGFSQDGYQSYPVRGSIALTQRGQQVLELLDYQGITPNACVNKA